MVETDWKCHSTEFRRPCSGSMQYKAGKIPMTVDQLLEHINQ